MLTFGERQSVLILPILTKQRQKYALIRVFAYLGSDLQNVRGSMQAIYEEWRTSAVMLFRTVVRASCMLAFARLRASPE